MTHEPLPACVCVAKVQFITHYISVTDLVGRTKAKSQQVPGWKKLLLKNIASLNNNRFVQSVHEEDDDDKDELTHCTTGLERWRFTSGCLPRRQRLYVSDTDHKSHIEIRNTHMRCTAEPNNNQHALIHICLAHEIAGTIR